MKNLILLPHKYKNMDYPLCRSNNTYFTINAYYSNEKLHTYFIGSRKDHIYYIHLKSCRI